MTKIGCLFLILLFTVPTSFATKQKALKGEDLLRQLEADFAADVAKHGHEAFVTYFADDGVEVVDGGSFRSREDMKKQEPWAAGTTLTWTPIHAEMSASNDMGFTYGNYVFVALDKEGKAVTNYGKYTSIWRKQKDGTWKVVVDMGNSSPTPAGK